MTMAETEPPRLETPEGGTKSQPKSPSQYRGYPYVWAWLVTLGATDPGYMERTCLQAQQENAPADAVYKYGDVWITLDQVGEDDQARVRAYGDSLTSHAAEVKQLREKPTSVAKADGDAEEHEYTVTYVARLTGVVRAPSMLDATKKLTPGEKAGPSGYMVLDLEGENGVRWHAAFDSGRGKLISSTDPCMRQPHVPSAPAVEPAVASPPAPAGPAPSSGVVVRRIKPHAEQPPQ